MPRRSPTVTADVRLEKADVPSFQLTDDESWRDQTIPTFDDPPKPHDQVLADLDERDDRLNGHTEVRPSERCGLRSSRGISCTARDEHDGPHSWQEPGYDLPTPAEATSVATSTDAMTGQAELPGTPEPDVDAYSIPFESQFNNQDFMAAPGIEEIAERLINSEAEFKHLIDVKIRYFWKRRGGTKGGAPRFAAPVKPGGLAAYALGRPQVALWLAADHCLENKLTNVQLEALIFDKLCQIRRDPNDHDQYRVVGPDFEGNILTIQRFGFWQKDLLELGANVKQLGLLEGIDLDSGEDGEDDEADEEEGEG